MRAERLRAEAARQCAAWDATVEQEVSVAVIQATLGSLSLCSSIARGDIAAFGVPTARSGADTEVAPREQIPPAVFAGPCTLTPDGLYLFVPGDLRRSLSQGPAFAEILLPTRDLARIFPRVPDKAPGLPGAASDRKPEPREADAVAAQQAAKAVPVSRTGTAGRPSSMHLIHLEHRRRIAAEEARDSLASEARYLREWLPETHPGWPVPGQSAVENALRDDHPQHLKYGSRMKRPG